jgi:hypothetical protein
MAFVCACVYVCVWWWWWGGAVQCAVCSVLTHLTFRKRNVNSVSNDLWLRIDVHEFDVNTLPRVAKVDLRRAELSKHAVGPRQSSVVGPVLYGHAQEIKRW